MSDLPPQRLDEIHTKAEKVMARFSSTMVDFACLRRLASEANIDLHDAELADIGGTLRREGDRWRLYLNRVDGPTLRLGTLARLLAHFYLHVESAATFVDGGFAADAFGPGWHKHREAVEFAACLLMPKKSINAQLAGSQPTAPRVLGLAKRYDVSPLTMALRLRQLGYTVPAAD